MANSIDCGDCKGATERREREQKPEETKSVSAPKSISTFHQNRLARLRVLVGVGLPSERRPWEFVVAGGCEEEG